MKLYVFLIQRKRDAEPWATVFTNKRQAEEYKDRVSKVVEVEVGKDEKVGADNEDAAAGPR